MRPAMPARRSDPSTVAPVKRAAMSPYAVISASPDHLATVNRVEVERSNSCEQKRWWREVHGFRNIAAHVYLDIDPNPYGRSWRTISRRCGLEEDLEGPRKAPTLTRPGLPVGTGVGTNPVPSWLLVSARVRSSLADGRVAQRPSGARQGGD